MNEIKVQDAENKICPFMSKAALDEKNHQFKLCTAYCQTTSCMAWHDTYNGGVCLLVSSNSL
ncbi:hypothetical protein [Sulfuricurvum sp.]|uniref:hypothetical protein n=1 Tax=Sulfuricurvum sp. TaxID=2025608 RepID=UPI0025E3A232|nr:hypothetical protein [Sulfuricurvum sp.]